MSRARRILILLAVGSVGVLAAGALVGQSSAATSLSGTWTGWLHPIVISGTLEGGFQISPAESYTWNGCPVSAGTVLATYTPTGGGSYSASVQWIRNTEGVCSVEYRTETGITASGSADSLTISGCYGAVCGTFSRAGGTPTTPTTPTTPKDTSRPRVRTFDRLVHASGANLTRPGGRAALDYSVKDDSGHATTYLTVYEGAQAWIRSHTRGSADGRKHRWPRPMTVPSSMTGPAYYCVWAEDSAGNVSRNAPLSSCAWISVLARIPEVSNGCGGAQWGPFWESVQNLFLDTQTYGDNVVHFRGACNLHDAGYGGFTVADTINHRYTDFRTWSRARVDAKFRDDLKVLCDRYIDGNTQDDRLALASCRGGRSLASQFNPVQVDAFPPGARAYYDGVRQGAKDAFDTDAMISGTQTTWTAKTAGPSGAKRDNR